MMVGLVISVALPIQHITAGLDLDRNVIAELDTFVDNKPQCQIYPRTQDCHKYPYTRVPTYIRGDDIPGACGLYNPKWNFIDIEERCFVVFKVGDKCQSTYWHEIMHAKLNFSEPYAEQREHLWMQENVFCA